MSSANDFLNLFDDQGYYKPGDGEVEVDILMGSGAMYPGKFRFKGGVLTSFQMDRGEATNRPERLPADSLKFLLHFDGENPQAVFIDQGRLVHHFEPRASLAKESFLANLRVARNLFVHSDSTRGALWLTPKTIGGFDEGDFPELKPDQRSELRQAVSAFEAVANRVPVDQFPSQHQYAQAATAFRVILNILNPYLATSEESIKVEKALRNVPFPPWVVNWDYELRMNSHGEDAVWVNVFAEPNGTRNEYGRFSTQIIPEIRQALMAEGIARWPYLRLRTATEFKTV